MKKVQFKTNINCSGCIANITPALNDAVGAGNWAVNTADPGKILTISTALTDVPTLVQVIKQAGYKAEQIES